VTFISNILKIVIHVIDLNCKPKCKGCDLAGTLGKSRQNAGGHDIISFLIFHKYSASEARDAAMRARDVEITTMAIVTLNASDTAATSVTTAIITPVVNVNSTAPVRVAELTTTPPPAPKTASDVAINAAIKNFNRENLLNSCCNKVEVLHKSNARFVLPAIACVATAVCEVSLLVAAGQNSQAHKYHDDRSTVINGCLETATWTAAAAGGSVVLAGVIEVVSCKSRDILK
jgi:hypothetical protein